MICENCGENQKIIQDNSGYPIYYYGTGPNNPEDAKYYFCSPECSHKWHKENIYNDKNST